MTGVLDPTFTALPYRDLGDVALDRARSLGAGHADFRFERVRYQRLGVRDGVLQGAADSEDVGFAVRVIHRGAWGFAAGVVLTPEEAVAVAERAVEVAVVAAAMTTTPVRARPRAGPRRRHLGVGLRRRPVRGPDRGQGRAARRLDPAAAAPRRRRSTPPPRCSRSTRTSTTPTSPAPAPPSSGSGCSPLRGDGHRRGDRGLRLHGLDRPAGRPRLGVPHRRPCRRLGLGRRARRDARAARREAAGAERRAGHLRPGHPPLQPVADHPRVDRPRHRARPGARLRGQLRRHVVRDVRQARHRCATAPRS